MINNVFLVLTMISLGGVLVILAAGVIGMVRRSGFNQKYGNQLMRARIGAQLLAVVFLILYFLTK